MADWREEERKTNEKIKKTEIYRIGNLELEKTEDELYVELRIGKEKIKLDHWAWRALHSLDYSLRPELPEEAALKVMTKNGEGDDQSS